jgi:hypothetical protein
MPMSAAQLIAEIIETAKVNNRPPPTKASLVDLSVETLQDILAMHSEPDVSTPPKPGKAKLVQPAPKICRWEPCSKEFYPKRGTSTAYCRDYCRELATIANTQKRLHGTAPSLKQVLRLRAKSNLRLKRRALNNQPTEKD